MIRAALLVLLFLPTFSLAQETPRRESAERVTRQDLAALVQVLDARLAAPLIDGSLQGDALRAANERFDRISIQFLGGRPERVATELEGWLEELEPAGAWRARRRPARAPLSRVRTALNRIIDEAEAAGSKLDEASLRILEARMELLVDAPSPGSSREFLLSTPALARELAGEARRVAAGERPYAMRTGDHWRTGAHGDRDLPLRVHRPAGLPADARPPLLVAFHGAGGDENFLFELAGDGHLKTLADRHGFVVACPSTMDFMGDAAAFDALVADLTRDHAVDPERVFLFGHSMGTGPVAGIGAARPGRVAGAVAVAGFGTRAPEGPPTLVIAGEVDPIVRASGLRRAAEAAKGGPSEVAFEVLANQGHTLMLPAAMERAVTFLGLGD